MSDYVTHVHWGGKFRIVSPAPDSRDPFGTVFFKMVSEPRNWQFMQTIGWSPYMFMEAEQFNTYFQKFTPDKAREAYWSKHDYVQESEMYSKVFDL